MYFFFVFQIFECVRVSIIINFMNLFRQMPVNTRRQTAGLSPLIKVSKKNERKQFQNGRCSIIHQAGQTQIQKLNRLMPLSKIMYKDKYMISLTERTFSCGSSQEFRKGFI